VVRFDGFLKVYEVLEDKKEDEDDEASNKLPNLDDVKTLELEKLLDRQLFTQPPPRYNEASLVKVLEERGIGGLRLMRRLSTRSRIANIVTKISNRFYPTEIGMVVCDLLVKNFPYIFDVAYTAKLEEELDEIEEGHEKWTDLLNGFYNYFVVELKDAGEQMEDIKRMEKKTDEKCDLCGSPLLLKWGKFGSFFACSAYNKKDKSSCTFTKENTTDKPDMNTPEGQEASEQEEYCDNCGRVMVLRRGPFGMFMSCPGFNEDPPCKTFRKLSSKQQQKQAVPQPTGEACPQCGKPLVLRQGSYGNLSPAPAIQVQVRKAKYYRGPQMS